MELLFSCPVTGHRFYSEKFDLVNNEGIVTDEDGNKSLKADVVVRDCPHCGKEHTFHANELSCPWSPGL